MKYSLVCAALLFAWPAAASDFGLSADRFEKAMTGAGAPVVIDKSNCERHRNGVAVKSLVSKDVSRCDATINGHAAALGFRDGAVWGWVSTVLKTEEAGALAGVVTLAKIMDEPKSVHADLLARLQTTGRIQGLKFKVERRPSREFVTYDVWAY